MLRRDERPVSWPAGRPSRRLRATGDCSTLAPSRRLLRLALLEQPLEVVRHANLARLQRHRRDAALRHREMAREQGRCVAVRCRRAAPSWRAPGPYMLCYAMPSWRAPGPCTGSAASRPRTAASTRRATRGGGAPCPPGPTRAPRRACPARPAGRTCRARSEASEEARAGAAAAGEGSRAAGGRRQGRGARVGD